MCTIPRLIPRFHFPTARFRSSSSPSNVTMLIVRRNFDRVPSFRLPYRSVKRVQPRFERELTFQTRWNIHLFDFSYESCQRSLPLHVIPRFYGQSYDHLERGINSIIMWKWKYRMNVKGEEVWILDNLWNERKMIIIIKREKRYDKMLLRYVNLRIECIIIRSKEYFIDTDFDNNK